MKNLYKSLPSSWVKPLFDAVKNNYVSNQRRNVGGNYGSLSGHNIVVRLPNGYECLLVDVHFGSYYFEVYLKDQNIGRIRVSNHWRCKTKNREIGYYNGYGNIPNLVGKVYTYKGFAAALID